MKKNKFGLRKWQRIIKDTRREVEQNIDIKLVGEGAETASLRKFLGDDACVLASGAEVGSVGGDDPDLLVLCLPGVGRIPDGLTKGAKEALSRGLEVLAVVNRDGLSAAATQARMVEAEIALGLSPKRVLAFAPGLKGQAVKQFLSTFLLYLDGKEIAAAAKLPVFRPMVTSRIINQIANENALFSAAGFIPAADMPFLTGNQMRMVLKIAAVFGEKISWARAKELMIVLGGGYTLRTVARQLIGLVPVAGWVVKGSVAYSGTQTMGRLAVKYFSDAALAEGQKDLTEGGS